MRKKIKVLHGPINIAGIGGYLSQIERKKGITSDFITYTSSIAHTKYEQSLGLKENGLKRRLYPVLHFLRALFKYNTFHFYFGVSFLALGIDLPILKLLGKKIVMTYCGTEIRLLEVVDSKRNPYYHLISFGNSKLLHSSKLVRSIKKYFLFRYNSSEYDQRKITMMKYQNLWVDKFFAIREMYAYASHVIPQEKIINNIPINNLSLEIVPEEDCFRNVTNPIPTIVHAPTHQGIKGTNYIEEALDNLKSKGYEFKYVKLENMNFERVKDIYKNEASIVIDQMLLGSFGSVAVEAMCYGKPTCVYLMDEVANGTCKDVPVYNINIDNIESRLANLIEDIELREKLGHASRKYIIDNFDTDKIGNQMKSLYESL